jgi:hypothetical protein
LTDFAVGVHPRFFRYHGGFSSFFDPFLFPQWLRAPTMPPEADPRPFWHVTSGEQHLETKVEYRSTAI